MKKGKASGIDGLTVEQYSVVCFKYEYVLFLLSAVTIMTQF